MSTMKISNMEIARPEVVIRLVAGGLVVVLCYAVLQNSRRWRGLPPGPWPIWPVIGNLHHLAAGGKFIHRNLAQLASKHGPVLHLRLGYAETVVISSPSLAKEVLQNQDKVFANRPPMEASRRLQFGTGNSLVMADLGPAWQELRRFATLHLFTPKRLLSFLPVRDQEINRAISKIKSSAGTCLDLTSHIDSLLENIVCRIAVGKRQDDLSHKIQRLKEVVHKSTVLFNSTMIGDVIPFLGFLDLKVKRSLDEHHAKFDALLEELIQQYELEQGQDDKIYGVDDASSEGAAGSFLGVLLPGFPNNKDRVKQLLQEFLVGAIDTASSVLDWAMAELMADPTRLQKLQREADEVVGRERMVEEEDVARLGYLRAVVKETLRLHMPAPLLLPRMSSEACVVGGYRLPKGTRVMVNAWAMARDPLLWDRPEQFLPERFDLSGEDSALDFQGQHFQFLPFGSGRRICPGLTFGSAIVEFALARLIHTFHWELPPGQEQVNMSESFGFVVSRSSHLFAIPTLRLAVSS